MGAVVQEGQSGVSPCGKRTWETPPGSPWRDAGGARGTRAEVSGVPPFHMCSLLKPQSSYLLMGRPYLCTNTNVLVAISVHPQIYSLGTISGGHGH